MKTVRVTYTILDIYQVPDNWSDEEIQNYLEEVGPVPCNDVEWDIDETYT